MSRISAYIAGVIAVIVLLLGIWILVDGNQPVTSLGGFTRFDEITLGDVTGTTTLRFISTSTTQGACIQFNATSSETTLNLTFAASSTAITTEGVTTVTRYGVCNDLAN